MQQSQWQQKAVQSFDTGYNCAQSVFVAFAPALGLDEKTALKIASTFGGGMHRGATCGALTGAMMALGLAAGFSEYSPEAKDEIGGLTRELVLRWQDQFGELDCRDILQIDPCDPEQKQAAREAGILAERCPNCVNGAVQILSDILRELDVL
ncbi:MAG: C-GCAxxG-C-C family protein [Candidatus Cloacimonadaceae bacterium]